MTDRDWYEVTHDMSDESGRFVGCNCPYEPHWSYWYDSENDILYYGQTS